MEKWLERLGAVGERLSLAESDAIQRTLIDAGAFAERTLRGPMDEAVAFMRIPKCASSSIHFAIARAYRSVWVREEHGLEIVDTGACDRVADIWEISNWEVRRLALSYQLARSGTRYVHGHFAVNRRILERFGDDYAFVTSLRDPVQRWISHYLWNRHLSTGRYNIESDLEEFVETERARGIGRIYTGYLVGPDRLDPSEPVPDHLRERARENLRRFDVVGIVEQMDAFRREFRDRFDVELDPRHRNTSPAPEGSDEIDRELRERIREICEPDLELYEFARDQL